MCVCMSVWVRAMPEAKNNYKISNENNAQNTQVDQQNAWLS